MATYLVPAGIGAVYSVHEIVVGIFTAVLQVKAVVSLVVLEKPTSKLSA